MNLLYAIRTKNEQDIYLQGLMDLRPIKKRRNVVKIDRGKEIIYFIKTADATKLRVCRKAFESLHAITTSRVKRLVTLLKNNAVPKDMRGRTPGSRRCMEGSVVQLIKEHIESYPVKVTHYGDCSKKYLSAELDVKTMFNMFLTKYPELTGKVKYPFYWKNFKENYNFSFGRPQVDVCCKCEELSQKLKNPTLNENAKRHAAAEKLIHVRRAKKFYKKMDSVRKLCREKNDVAALSFDYMQNLPLPHIPVQEIFYYRQLWLNEFCIHNLKDDTANFYSYHEGLGHKGPNEVCTFLWMYIQNQIPSEVKTLYLFSDGCVGQNKNHTVVRFLMSLTAMGRFDEIYHFFPQRGHSFLPCDRDFGCVKRKLKKYDRIYVPSEYESVIFKASLEGKYKIVTIKSSDILNFVGWWQKFYKKTCLSVNSQGKNVPKEQKVTFQVSTYSQFAYKSAKPGYVQVREFIDGLVIHDFYLRKGACARALPTHNAYAEGKVPINEKKITDIKKVQN